MGAMNRNSVISLLIGVLLGAGGYYIVDRTVSPAGMEVQPTVAEQPTPLPPVAAGEAQETEEAPADTPEAAAVSEALPDVAAEPEALPEAATEPEALPEAATEPEAEATQQ